MLLFLFKTPPALRTSLTIPRPCCRSGDVDVQLNLNQPGFVLGEQIFITGEIVNNSGAPIKKIYLSLVQVHLILIQIFLP